MKSTSAHQTLPSYSQLSSSLTGEAQAPAQTHQTISKLAQPEPEAAHQPATVRYYPESLEDDTLSKMPPQLAKTLHQFAESLGKAIDAKDSNTSSHSDEVAELSLLIGESMGLPQQWLETLHIAGHLHDIGKIGIPDSVLLKTGPLTDTEWQLIRMHPEIGASIVAPVNAFSQETSIREMILHHHERYDGKGYPDGLAGKDIPLGARIIAVADSLSAMLQSRPYRKAMPFQKALEEIYQNSGTQFDPEVVHAMLRISREISKKLHTQFWQGNALSA